MGLTTNKKYEFAIDIFMIILGTFIMGFAFSVFLVPNNISTGGFSGLAMIFTSLFGSWGINWLNNSIIYLILNLGLFIYAYRTLGKKFAIKALIGIVSYSLAMEVFEFIDIDIVYETLISAVYGGAIMGVGIGIVVRFGGSTGGSDMIASVVRKKYPRFTIGRIVVAVDIVVIALSLVVFSDGWLLLPYTILALFISIFTTDFVNEGYKQVRAYNIITIKPDEIGRELMTKLYRGCTLTQAKGMHTGEDKYIVTCLISKFQSSTLKRIVRDCDPSAFVYATPVSEVIGSWAKEDEVPKMVKNNTHKKNKGKKDDINTDN